ncbi:hypothetical protein ACFQOY_13745 [Enterococcus alcedinis]|uniref:Uncharacterized protein n=1 Tax=Enterococcus alcedinis TaxID=1274384 RepID=A0A917N446_9ENTE|nr:hypothetical protein [Enterococcus alcedinis]MBP2100974.1 hypothetical protein [Enterococcus alcedinis]GGI64729.1 hypothetical protein GCM10011482_03830 [Enterococcus alcedinis]
MQFKLMDFQRIEKDLDSVVKNDIQGTLNNMKKENIELDGWELIDIPYERTYLFFNKGNKEAFDVELDERNTLVPHYYGVVDNSRVTKHPTFTIKESIKKYKLN